MVISAPPFAHRNRGRRPNIRDGVHLDCKLHFATFEISGTVTDLFKGGSGILLFFGPHNALRSITIEGFGTAGARVAWQSEDRLGLSFVSNVHTKSVTMAYFEANKPATGA